MKDALYATQVPYEIGNRQISELEQEFLKRLNFLLAPTTEHILDYLKLRLDWRKTKSRRDGSDISAIALDGAEWQGRIDEIESLIKLFSDPEGEAERVKVEGL